MHCKNCNTSLKDQSGYCNNCGAKVIRNRLTVKNLFEHFSEQFLNYDNKFLQTFIALLVKPQDVIGTYIAGTRKKYVNVIGFFSIAIMITGVEYFILNKFFPEFLDFSIITAIGAVGPVNEIFGFILEYQIFILISLIPIYALMAKIVFFNLKKFNYTEHLVIFMYVISQLSILGFFLSIPSAALGFKMGGFTLFIIVLQLVYSAYCLKALYGLSLKGIILRTLFFLVVFVVFYVTANITFSVIAMILNPEWYQELIKAQENTG